MAYRANLFDFGAVAGDAAGANAATNDAAFAAAMASPTKIIEMEPELFEFSQTIHISQHAKKFRGIDGNDVFQNTNNGTRLRWHGAAGGVMVKMDGPAPGVDVHVPEFSGACLIGNGLADRGIDVRGAVWPHADGIQVKGLRNLASSMAYYFGYGALKDGDNNRNAMYRGDFRNLSAIVKGPATGMFFDGKFGFSHPCLANFESVHMIHEHGQAFYFRGADDIHMSNVTTSQLPDGTGYAVFLDGLEYYVMGCAIWGAVFCKVPPGVPTKIYSRGDKARQNVIYGLMGVDNQPEITITQGSELYYDYQGGGYTPTLAAEKALRRMPKRLERTY